MALGLGRVAALWRSIGGTVYVPPSAGPTQDILITPSSITLASVGSTATLAPVAVDGSGVPTGQRVYLYSTDPTHVTVNPDTYVATRVALGGTPLIYGTLAAPVVVTAPNALSEPNLSTMPGVDMVFSVGNDLGIASGDTIDSMYATNAVAAPRRFRPFTNDPALVSLIPRPSGTGAGVGLRSTCAGAAQPYGSWQLVPTSDNINNPGHGPVFNRQADNFVQHRVMITCPDETTKPFSVPFRPKGVEGWHGFNNYRLEFGGTDARPPGSSHLTHFVAFEFFHTPFYSGGQPVGPWLEDIANTGDLWRFTYEFKSNSLSPGTVNILLQSGDYYFAQDFANQTTPVTNGQRIMIPNSTAEWVVTDISGGVDWGGALRTHAHIQRQPDIVGNVGTFDILMFGGHRNVQQTAVFSNSRAGALTSGAHGGYVTMAGSTLYWEVSDFDGDKHCTLTRLQPDSDDDSSPLARDYIGAQFNDTQDGIARMWVCPDSTPVGQGTLIIDMSPTGVGVTPPGGEGPWCSKADIATLPVNDNWEWFWFPFPLTSGTGMIWDMHGPFDWGATGGLGSPP